MSPFGSAIGKSSAEANNPLRLLDDLHQVTPKTLLNESVIVRQVVDFTRSRKQIRDDPLPEIKLEKKISENTCWTRAEIDRILAASTGWHRDVPCVVAETGMRISEARWMTWYNVDFRRNAIHIRAKIGWRPQDQ